MKSKFLAKCLKPTEGVLKVGELYQFSLIYRHPFRPAMDIFRAQLPTTGRQVAEVLRKELNRFEVI